MMSHRIFIGCPITPDLRMKLNQSPVWSSSRVNPAATDEPIELRHEGQDYLGYLLDAQTDIKTLKDKADAITSAASRYCRNGSPGTLRMMIFSQLFIG